MGVNKKGGLVGGFDQLRAPDAPTISVAAGNESVVVTITNPTDTGGGDITGYAVSTLTGPIEDTTFAVTVVSSGGNKYAIDGTTQGTVTLHKGHTYIFDQSDSSNSSHPLRLSTTSNGSHGGGSEYTTGVTTSGTPGSAGAFTKIAVDSGAASTLYYYCSSHSGMGGSATVKTSLQGGASGSSSPITVSSLTNSESYNVRASAINVFGQSPYSDAASASPALQRALYFGGYGWSNVIDFFDITTLGNATDFGDVSYESYYSAAVGSATRILHNGGVKSSVYNTIEFVTASSTGNTTDFGDMTTVRSHHECCNSATRGIFGGGYTGAFSTPTNIIDYVTMASEGDATNFGDLSVAKSALASTSSSTRGIFAGGQKTSPQADLNTIEYITISSQGDVTDFGDLTNTTEGATGSSSGTRGIIAGGKKGGSNSNVIEYITIASTGSGTDFGDLPAAEAAANASASNSTRSLIYPTGYAAKVVYITIASTGNTTDFGDLTSARTAGGMASNSNGGLQ